MNSSNTGHLHFQIKKGVEDQLRNLTLTSRAIYSNKLHIATKVLCQTLKFPKAILTNISAEAVETAIKFSRRWAYEIKKVQPD